MRISPRHTCIGGLLLLRSLCTYAGEVLSWEQCVHEAATHNPDIKSAEELWRSNTFQEGVAQSNYYPQISLNLTASEDKNQSTPFNREYDANVKLTQNLFAGFNDSSKTDQARYKSEASFATLNIAKAKLSFDLKSSFQNVVYAVENEKLTADISRRRLENYQLVELQFEGGLENRGSVLLSKADYEQAEFENFQARNAIQTAKSQLAVTIGRETNNEFTVTGQIPTKEPSEHTPEFQEIARVTPQHAEASANEKAAEYGIEVARSGFYPSLVFTGSAGKSGDEFFPSENGWNIQIGLSYPLFSGAKDYYSMKSASAQWASSTQVRVSTDLNLLSSLRDAYYNYLESVKKLSVDLSYLEAAKVRAEIARARYNSGLMSFEEWYLIENDLIGRQKNYLNSKRTRILNEAAWEQVQGKGVFHE